jgi:hypothetical protein
MKELPPADLCFVCPETPRDELVPDKSLKKPKDKAMTVYVTVPNDEEAKETARLLVKYKLCTKIRVYPGASGYMFWKLLQSGSPEDNDTFAHLSLVGKGTIPYSRLIKKTEGKKKKKVQGNDKEVVLAVKTRQSKWIEI